MKAKYLVKRKLRFEGLETRQLLSAVPGLHAAAVENTTSSNWSGYAIQTNVGAVSAVSGSWKVPAVSGNGPAYSAVWVGIDGYNSSTVEQIGTESDVSSNGATSYYAWYEMYPSGSVTISTSSKDVVHAGDSITASVQYQSAKNDFLLTIADTTGTGWTYSTAIPQSAASTGRYGYGSSSQAQRSSAEWVVEAPSSNYGVLPLADFAPVTFTATSATIGGVAGAINSTFPFSASAQLYLINMASYASTEDTTSALTDSGSGASATSTFAVTYDAPTAVTTPVPATPSGNGGGSGSGGGGGGGWGRGGGGGGWGWSSWYQTNIPSQDQSDSRAAAAYEATDRFFASLAAQPGSDPV